MVKCRHPHHSSRVSTSAHRRRINCYVAKPMIANLLKFILLMSLTNLCNAQYFESLKLDYSEKTYCQPETDNCSTVVTLTKDGNKPIEIKGLNGPIHLSTQYAQVFSCEANTYDDRKYAKLFNLQGELLATVQHRGSLHDCGTTIDGALYWLHYYKVVNSKPINVLVVFSNTGKVIFEKELSYGGLIKFKYYGKEYSLKIDKPQWPV